MHRMRAIGILVDLAEISRSPELPAVTHKKSSPCRQEPDTNETLPYSLTINHADRLIMLSDDGDDHNRLLSIQPDSLINSMVSE